VRGSENGRDVAAVPGHGVRGRPVRGALTRTPMGWLVEVKDKNDLVLIT